MKIGREKGKKNDKLIKPSLERRNQLGVYTFHSDLHL